MERMYIVLHQPCMLGDVCSHRALCMHCVCLSMGEIVCNELNLDFVQQLQICVSDSSNTVHCFIIFAQSVMLIEEFHSPVENFLEYFYAVQHSIPCPLGHIQNRGSQTGIPRCSQTAILRSLHHFLCSLRTTGLAYTEEGNFLITSLRIKGKILT